MTSVNASCDVTATASVWSISKVSELDVGVYGLPTVALTRTEVADVNFAGRTSARK